MATQAVKLAGDAAFVMHLNEEVVVTALSSTTQKMESTLTMSARKTS